MIINKLAILLTYCVLTPLVYGKNLDKTVTAKNVSLVEWDSPEGIHRLEEYKLKIRTGLIYSLLRRSLNTNSKISFFEKTT